MASMVGQTAMALWATMALLLASCQAKSPAGIAIAVFDGAQEAMQPRSSLESQDSVQQERESTPSKDLQQDITNLLRSISDSYESLANMVNPLSTTTQPDDTSTTSDSQSEDTTTTELSEVTSPTTVEPQDTTSTISQTEETTTTASTAEPENTTAATESTEVTTSTTAETQNSTSTTSQSPETTTTSTAQPENTTVATESTKVTTATTAELQNSTSTTSQSPETTTTSTAQPENTTAATESTKVTTATTAETQNSTSTTSQSPETTTTSTAQPLIPKGKILSRAARMVRSTGNMENSLCQPQEGAPEDKKMCDSLKKVNKDVKESTEKIEKGEVTEEIKDNLETSNEDLKAVVNYARGNPSFVDAINSEVFEEEREKISEDITDAIGTLQKPDGGGDDTEEEDDLTLVILFSVLGGFVVIGLLGFGYSRYRRRSRSTSKTNGNVDAIVNEAFMHDDDDAGRGSSTLSSP